MLVTHWDTKDKKKILKTFREGKRSSVKELSLTYSQPHIKCYKTKKQYLPSSRNIRFSLELQTKSQYSSVRASIFMLWGHEIDIFRFTRA